MLLSDNTNFKPLPQPVQKLATVKWSYGSKYHCHLPSHWPYQSQPSQEPSTQAQIRIHSTTASNRRKAPQFAAHRVAAVATCNLLHLVATFLFLRTVPRGTHFKSFFFWHKLCYFQNKLYLKAVMSWHAHCTQCFCAATFGVWWPLKTQTTRVCRLCLV